MVRWLLGLIVVLGAAGGLVLGALNPGQVMLDLGLFEWSASLGAVVALAVAIGVCVGLLVGILAGRFLLGTRTARRASEPGTKLPTNG